MFCSGNGASQNLLGENASTDGGRALGPQRPGGAHVRRRAPRTASCRGESRRRGEGRPAPRVGGHPRSVHACGAALRCAGAEVRPASGL